MLEVICHSFNKLIILKLNLFKILNNVITTIQKYLSESLIHKTNVFDKPSYN